MNQSETDDRETVVVGVLFSPDRDRVLLSRRKAGAHLGGLWEFPGGKAGQGESNRQTLERELAEELGITVTSSHSLTVLDYDYPDRKLRLAVRITDSWEGDLKANESQQLEWVRLDRLDSIEMPPANRVIKRLISLPPLYLITPDLQVYDEVFLSRAREFLQSGLKLLQFRSLESPFSDHAEVVQELARQCKYYSCRLLYNGTPEEAEYLGVDGVHLNSSRLMKLSGRPLRDKDWVAASCHDLLELDHAARIGVDFCVFSPVHKSPSHPVGDILGWQKFRTVAMESTIPVYALGGVSPAEIHEARNAGAHGVAMISGVWNARDPVSIIKRLS